jgi:hypothetical protein
VLATLLAAAKAGDHLDLQHRIYKGGSLPGGKLSIAVDGLTLSNGAIYAPLEVNGMTMVNLLNLHLHSDSKQRGALCVLRGEVRCTDCTIHGVVIAKTKSTLEIVSSTLHGGDTNIGITNSVLCCGSKLRMVDTTLLSSFVGVNVVAHGSSAEMTRCKMMNCEWGASVHWGELSMTDCEVCECNVGVSTQHGSSYAANGTTFKRCNKIGLMMSDSSRLQIASCSFESCATSIHVQGLRNAEITDSHFKDSRVCGVECVGSAIKVSCCDISGCDIGVNVRAVTSSCTLAQVNILDCSFGAAVAESGMLSMQGCVFKESDIGIKATGSSVVKVHDSWLHNSCVAAIIAWVGSRIDVQNATLLNCHVGVKAANDSHVDIRSTSVQHSANAVSTSNGATIVMAGCTVEDCSVSVEAMFGGCVYVKEGTTMDGVVTVYGSSSVFGACCRCGVVGRRLMACKCRRVRYCCKECQAADWKEHKKSCGK